ncbi:MAG: OmpH family outer membrane protein [Prevotella sp.]|jgi:outer membrane protein|nr:OmpH family outer membrane protein [Prevotella sp.]
MKKQMILILCLISALAGKAQDSTHVEVPAPVVATPSLAYGYFSYNDVLQAMPDYVAAQRNIAALKTQYESEMKRSEDEFNKKYVEFLDGQREFAPSILKKRQAELQDMMAKNVAFKEESVRLLEKAEKDLMQPVRNKLNTAIQHVGKELKLAFVLNTDNNALPYVDASMGRDITNEVMKAIGK